MENKDRIRCVLLGLICLMPSLFFWVTRSLPIEALGQLRLSFPGATRLEFIISGIVFPLIAVALGWLAYRRCESKVESLLVIGFGFIEIAAAAAAAIFGFGI